MPRDPSTDPNVSARVHTLTIAAQRTAVAASGQGEVGEAPGWFLVDSRTGIAALNHAFVTDVDLAAAHLPAPADWFGQRGEEFRVILAIPGDATIQLALAGQGYVPERRQPVMARALPLDVWPLPPGVAVHPVTDAASVAAYLAARTDASRNQPPDEVEAAFVLKLVRQGTFRYFVATDGSRPVATAMSFADGGVASVANVFVAPDWRKRGLGAAVTAAAFNAWPDATLGCLEASAMGEPVYSRMGFERVFDYLRLAPPER